MPAYWNFDLLQLRSHGQRHRDNVLSCRRFTVRQALQWITYGWRIWKKNLFFWWMLGIIYVLFAFTATRIPFLGTFFVLLLTPVMAAGVLSTVRQQLTRGGLRSTRYLLRRAKSLKEKLLVLVGRPAQALFKGFTDDDKMLTLMGVGFGTAFVGVLAQLLTLNIGGAFYVTSGTLSNIGFFQGVRLMIAYGGMFVMYLALVAIYIYFLSLFILDKKPLGVALFASLRAFTQNAVPCLAYSATLVLPLLLMGLVAKAYPVICFFGLLGAGSIALPLLINSAYCTSRLMYRV